MSEPQWLHKLIIPMEIPSQNVRDKQCWQARMRDNKKWFILVRAAMQPWMVSDGKKRSVVITSLRKRKITDHANLVGGAKGLVDALVKNHLLVDDSDEWVSIEYRQQLAKGSGVNDDKPATVVTFLDV